VLLSASLIDAHVGQRLRERREALGMSQGRLGRHLGLTFSQVQKYEKGSNRIGAGRLYQISQFLGVSPLYFFEGLEPGATARAPGRPPAPGVQSGPEELAALNEAYAAIPDPDTRKSVLALVRSLSVGGPIRQGSVANGE
jgi:transcriptional regulator with XRE-family HTH domain